MASYQYVYHMDGVLKTYFGGKKTFENIRLSFLPGVKIGVVGVNGSGKSTLLRIMAGQDKDFSGEARAAKGATVGYLPQEMGCGSGMTCWRRLREWQDAGVWQRLHELLLAKLNEADRIDWSRAAIDSSHVRAFGGAKRPARAPSTARDAAPSTT